MDILEHYILDGLFSDEQFEAFSNILPSTVETEALKKTGNVSIVTEEKDGMVTESIEYTSFDGLTSFTKTHTYLKANQTAERIKQLNELMALAVQREDYLRARDVKQIKDEILKQED